MYEEGGWNGFDSGIWRFGISGDGWANTWHGHSLVIAQVQHEEASDLLQTLRNGLQAIVRQVESGELLQVEQFRWYTRVFDVIVAQVEATEAI